MQRRLNSRSKPAANAGESAQPVWHKSTTIDEQQTKNALACSRLCSRLLFFPSNVFSESQGGHWALLCGGNLY